MWVTFVITYYLIIFQCNLCGSLILRGCNFQSVVVCQTLYIECCDVFFSIFTDLQEIKFKEEWKSSSVRIQKNHVIIIDAKRMNDITKRPANRYAPRTSRLTAGLFEGDTALFLIFKFIINLCIFEREILYLLNFLFTVSLRTLLPTMKHVQF